MKLIQTAVNEPVVRHAREQAEPGTSSYVDADGWELHAHPDLSDRLRDVSPAESDVFSVHGLHVMAVHGVAAGFVQGTGCLFLRLPAEPPAQARSRQSYDHVFSAEGWYSVGPWASDLLAEAGDRRLRGLAAAACRYTLTLVPAQGPRSGGPRLGRRSGGQG